MTNTANTIHGLQMDELDKLIKKAANLVPIANDCAVTFEDLVSVGKVAALEAATRWNANSGAKFSSYARHSILGDMRAHNMDFARAGKAVSTRKDRKGWKSNSQKFAHDTRIDAKINDSDGPSYHETIGGVTESVEDALIASEDLERIQTWAATLTGKRRYVWVCLVGGETYTEIAESLNVSKQRIGQIYNEIIKQAKREV